MIGTIAAASQFLTAAAHADEYPALPITLLRATSFDLRRNLSEMSSAIARLELT